MKYFLYKYFYLWFQEYLDSTFAGKCRNAQLLLVNEYSDVTVLVFLLK